MQVSFWLLESFKFWLGKTYGRSIWPSPPGRSRVNIPSQIEISLKNRKLVFVNLPFKFIFQIKSKTLPGELVRIKPINLPTYPTLLSRQKSQKVKRAVSRSNIPVYVLQIAHPWNLKKRKQDFWSILNSARIRSPGGNVNQDSNVQQE